MDALDHGNTVDETDEAVLREAPMAPSVPSSSSAPRWRATSAAPSTEAVRPVRPVRDAREPRRRRRAGRRRACAAQRRGDPHGRPRGARGRPWHILEDDVVAEAADIDTCLLLGAGFLFWLGGITKHPRPDRHLGARRRPPARRARPPRRLRRLPLPRRGSEVCSDRTARRELGERRLFEGAARRHVLPECTT